MAGASKEERFAEFLARLAVAAPARSAGEALRRLNEILNQVEDELSEISYAPQQWQTDGRLYPPRADAARDVPGRKDLVRYRSKAHHTYIRDNGAVEIHDAEGAIIFSKAGADGAFVDISQTDETR